MIISRAKRAGGFLAIGGLSLLLGCSSFSREWSSAPAKATSVGSIEGRWHGYWKSDVNGHNGDLKCVVTRNPDQTYRANFSAVYWKILTFTYVANLKGTPTPTPTTIQLSGQQDLGAMAGGVYTYEGTATDTNFDCTYSSKYDHGKFVMTRPTDDAAK